MKLFFPSLLTSFSLLGSISSIQASEEAKASAQVAVPFEPFTGKITKNKVRLRLQPSYDGYVLRELNKNDMVVIAGETEDFYAIAPPSDFRAYVFRTYVLDSIVEGKRVNVRLKPDLEAPVVAQLNSGDRVEGVIYFDNNKWLEIKPPATARFYIAKEYVEKIGDAGLMARLEKKREEALNLLGTTDSMAQAEMLKPFEQINIDNLKANYQHIIHDYPEVPEASAKAQEQLLALQNAYLNKRLAYLEAQTKTVSTTQHANKKLSDELQAQKNKIATLEQQLEQNRQLATMAQNAATPVVSQQQAMPLPVNMTAWLPVEEKLFNSWLQQKGHGSPQEFYEEQKQQAFYLRGVIEPYNRPVRNKPGDYMLVNSTSKLPIAYLYSTHVNLQDYLGHEISLYVAPRNNNNYAFPAYFVLSIN